MVPLNKIHWEENNEYWQNYILSSISSRMIHVQEAVGTDQDALPAVVRTPGLAYEYIRQFIYRHN